MKKQQKKQMINNKLKVHNICQTPEYQPRTINY